MSANINSVPVSPVTIDFDEFFEDTLIQSGDCGEIKKSIYRCLKYIVDNCGTEDYSFNLATEKLCRHLDASDGELLQAILDEAVSEAETADVAFAACYTLSLLYKKLADAQAETEYLDRLDELYNNYSGAFSRYILLHELKSRCLKRRKKYDNALREDQLAIEALARKGKENSGLFISFASTVCKMIESEEEVDADDISSAIEYADKATLVKPKYAKYHYIKGLLLFNRHKYDKDCELLCDYSDAAAAISRAKQLVDRKSHHYRAEKNKYNKTAEQMKNAAEERVRQLKEGIINSASREQAVKLMPKLPLAKGAPYIFVSYSHADYKAVYCDLIELMAGGAEYAFVYDGGTAFRTGTKWTEQAEKYILSESCRGTVFYLSPDFILGDSTRKEAGYVRNRFDNEQNCYFTVNLTEDRPFKLLLDTLGSRTAEELINGKLDRKGMIDYLLLFTDENIYVKRSANPGDTMYIDEIKSAIGRKIRCEDDE